MFERLNDDIPTTRSPGAGLLKSQQSTTAAVFPLVHCVSLQRRRRSMRR